MEENGNHDQDLTTMEETKPITERSTLTISLVIALVAGLISFTWFVRGLASDVRNIQTDLTGIKQSIANLSKVDQLQTDVRELKQYGSDVSRKLALDFIDLKRDFELYKVQNGATHSK
jgi:cell division protein FtsB